MPWNWNWTWWNNSETAPAESETADDETASQWAEGEDPE